MIIRSNWLILRISRDFSLEQTQQSLRDSDADGNVVDRVSSEEQGGEEICIQEGRHHGGASKVSVQQANKWPGHNMTGKASAASQAGDLD